jgi:outer membrane receptor protein involved in Fe transport
MRVKERATRSLRAVFVTTSLAALTAPLFVHAQTEKTAEVVVTAQKHEQRLQDVPMSVTALGAAQLVEQNKVKLEDYFRDVPGLQVSALSGGQDSLTIRGVSTGYTTNPTVGITIDDVPYGSSSVLAFGSTLTLDLDPSDLQRIEVLKGPQGTLYGASSLGGLLKYVTVDPSTARFSGRIEADGSTVDGGGAGGGLRGAVNIPLVPDTLAIRASGFVRSDPGYVDNVLTGASDVNKVDAYGGRLGLLWRINDKADLTLGALYQRNKGDGASDVDADTSLKPKIGDLKQSRLGGTGQYLTQAEVFTAKLKVALPYGVNFISVTGATSNLYDTTSDFTYLTGSAAQFFFGAPGATEPYRFHTRRLSQEFRLERTDATLDWTVGAFYTNEHSGDTFYVNAVVPATGAVKGALLDEFDTFTYREWAAFGTATWHVIPRLDLEVGGRFSENRQYYDDFTGGPFGAGDFVQSSSDNSTTFVVSPSYKVNSNLLIYARVASGYRPGGPNAGIFSPSAPKTYTADTSINYEAGIKGSLDQGRANFDVAVYYIDWSKIQVGLIDPVTGFLYLINAGNASSTGLEASGSWRPSRGLTLTANAAINQAKLEDDLPITGGVVPSGQTLPNAPKFSGTFGAEQEFPLVGLYKGFVGGSVSYVGSRQGNFPNAVGQARIQLPSYTTGDVRLGAKGDGWVFTAYVHNVGDERGVLFAGPATASPFSELVIQPRTFGVSLAKSF